MDKKFLVLGGVSLVSLAIGGLGGYKYAEKKLIRLYEEALEEETEALKQRYVVFKKSDEYETPSDALRRLIPEKLSDEIPDEVSTETLERVAEGLKRTQYDKMYKPTGEPIVKVPDVHKAVFEPEGVAEPASIFRDVAVELGDPEENSGYVRELNDVSNTKPFIISRDEFFENEPENDQVQWIYWAGDQVLMDEDRNPVTEVNKLVGVRNLSQFGVGSSDKRIVYVRNQARGIDYEILYHESRYAEEIGLPPAHRGDEDE